MKEDENLIWRTKRNEYEDKLTIALVQSIKHCLKLFLQYQSLCNV